MKTEQEQIEKMARTMCGYCSTDGKCAVSKNGREPDICANVDTEHCLYKEYAERLIESGYGNVSEYKAEIERLKSKNEQSRKLGILGYEATVEFIDDVVSEPFAACKDIEKYAKQFRNRIISVNEKEIKQAKIDVLNTAKERCDLVAEELEDEIDHYGSSAAYSCAYEIKKLIKEVDGE